MLDEDGGFGRHLWNEREDGDALAREPARVALGERRSPKKLRNRPATSRSDFTNDVVWHRQKWYGYGRKIGGCHFGDCRLMLRARRNTGFQFLSPVEHASRTGSGVLRGPTGR